MMMRDPDQDNWGKYNKATRMTKKLMKPTVQSRGTELSLVLLYCACLNLISLLPWQLKAGRSSVDSIGR